MPAIPLRNTLFYAGSAVLICNDLFELITAISELDPLPLLMHTLGLTIAKYQPDN